MRMSFCSCQVHGNGSYFDFDDKGKRSNGPITCIWASIAPSGKVNVSGTGLGSCLTYGSVVICGITHYSFGPDNGLSITPENVRGRCAQHSDSINPFCSI